MIFLAPIAAAGYMYWDKKRKEQAQQLANENGEGDKQQPHCDELTREDTAESKSSVGESSEEGNWDMVGSSVSTAETAESDTTTELRQGAQQEVRDSPRESSKVSNKKANPEAPLGPIGRWNKFCTNLQKEFEKAEARKLREAELARMQQVPAKATLEPVSATKSAIPAIESQ